MATAPELRDIFMAAIPFVMSLRKESGGFGATPGLPPTVEDTYNALNILILARKYDAADESVLAPSADKALHSYLAAARLNLPAGVKILFQLLWCRNVAGLKLDRDRAMADVMARMATSLYLEDWYYGARIFNEVLGETNRLPGAAANATAILGNKWRAVDEAWMHLYLARQFRQTLPQPTPELTAWFQAAQNGDGGFGFFPGTTSFVENCHASLRALAFLKAKPLDPARAFSFLAACQTKCGGFGRSLRAAPFLDTTWHGLAALALIAGK